MSALAAIGAIDSYSFTYTAAGGVTVNPKHLFHPRDLLRILVHHIEWQEPISIREMYHDVFVYSDGSFSSIAMVTHGSSNMVTQVKSIMPFFEQRLYDPTLKNARAYFSLIFYSLSLLKQKTTIMTTDEEQNAKTRVDIVIVGGKCFLMETTTTTSATLIAHIIIIQGALLDCLQPTLPSSMVCRCE